MWSPGAALSPKRKLAVLRFRTPTIYLFVFIRERDWRLMRRCDYLNEVPYPLDLDTTAPLHHSAIMRLTINLDDDLYAMARSHAIATKTSISKAVGDLLRRNSTPTPPDFTSKSSTPNIHPKSGFPVSVSGSHQITEEDMRRAMVDDLVRPLEIAGYSPEQIEEMLSE